MILGIGQGNDYFYFALQGDFKVGYGHNLDFGIDRGASITHPATIKWEGGSIKDLNLSLLMVATGPVEDFIPPGLNSARDLVAAVEKIHDWALPPFINTGGQEIEAAANMYLQAVNVFVGTWGNWWFYRTGIIKDIDVTFKPPYDIDTGMPMVAEVNLVLVMSLSSITVFGKDTIVDQSKMPHRPWKFDKLW